GRESETGEVLVRADLPGCVVGTARGGERRGRDEGAEERFAHARPDSTMSPMSHLTAFATEDLKLVYRVLHANLLDQPDLMDSEFLNELQLWLQTLAKIDGVDIGNHARWDAWLASQATCQPD